MTTHYLQVLDANGNPPAPVPYTLTTNAPEGGPWYAMPVQPKPKERRGGHRVDQT